MPGKNRVEQKVSLNTDEYKKGQQRIRQEQRQTTEDTKRSTKDQAKQYEEATERIKKKNLELGKSLKDVSKEFGKNLWNGTAITAGAAGVTALKKQYESAAKSILTLDQSMSRLVSRFDLSKDRAKNLRRELQSLGTQTGISGGALGEAAEQLMSANKKHEAVGINDIGKFSAMGGGDPKEIARTVIDFLKGSGQELSAKNVKDLLSSANAVSRGGDLSLQEALKSMTIDPASKNKLNLSNKENGALIAAASGVGQDRGTSIAGLNAVLKKSVGGMGEGAALAGILGIKGGSFMKGGKFDVSKLQEASQNLNKQGLGKADFTKLLESSGLGSEEAEGLYSILKDFDKFDKSFKSVISDQKTLEDSFGQSTDNLQDAFSRMSEKIAKATTEIGSPLAELGKDLLDGNFAKALEKAPGNLKESGAAVMDNKAIVALGIGATALTGALAKKIGGVLGFGDAGGTAKGLALQAATGGKVQPVVVVNVNELASAMKGTGILDGGLDVAKKAGGGGIMAGILAKLAGTKAAGLAVNAGISAAPYAAVAAAGAGGYAVGKYAVNPVLDKFTQGKTAEGFEGNIVEQLFFKLDKLFGGENAANIQKAQKVQLEIVDNGERLTAKPKAVDVVKNNFGK
jgi:hypothetical protein